LFDDLIRRRDALLQRRGWMRAPLWLMLMLWRGRR